MEQSEKNSAMKNWNKIVFNLEENSLQFGISNVIVVLKPANVHLNSLKGIFKEFYERFYKSIIEFIFAKTLDNTWPYKFRMVLIM